MSGITKSAKSLPPHLELPTSSTSLLIFKSITENTLVVLKQMDIQTSAGVKWAYMVTPMLPFVKGDTNITLNVHISVFLNF